MKPMFLVQGPVATRSGYGEHARDLIRAIISIDKWDVKVINTRWGNTPMNALDVDDPNDKVIIDRFLDKKLDNQPEIFMQVSVPNEFTGVGKYNIGVTAGIETNICSSANWSLNVAMFNLYLYIKIRKIYCFSKFFSGSF